MNNTTDRSIEDIELRKQIGKMYGAINWMRNHVELRDDNTEFVKELELEWENIHILACEMLVAVDKGKINAIL